ncbi:MAG: hypothetical protein B0D92_03340 [Spirochaeta sp. LUC14_002_19_P3]|nr:MAG: hypothetical protein B0D92_03340 [Spirochaeta sp. LUC14_002_19_P3]
MKRNSLNFLPKRKHLNTNWTRWTAWRFLTGRRGGRGRLVFLFSVVLICAGVAALNTILAVMNGLQQGFISSILEIGSYHLRLLPNDEDGLESALRAADADTGVRIAVPFREGQTMLSSGRGHLSGALIRGVPEDVYIKDKGLASRLDISEGRFNLAGSGIVLGEELALNLGVIPGDRIIVLSLGKDSLASRQTEFRVTGLFECGYLAYESGMAFISADNAQTLIGDMPLEIGIKLQRPELDKAVIQRLQKKIDGQFISWRESNRAFFGALRNEKNMMIILLALIFVVVAVNIDHALRRMAQERAEDLSILKAVGASPWNIRSLFLRHGLVIGGLGGISGSALGVLIGKNIDGILRLVHRLRYAFNASSFSTLRLQTLEAFFQHTQVMAKDVIIILVLAVVLTFLAAVRASSMAANAKPAEVLRSE